MLFNARVVAFLLGVSVGGITTAFLSLLSGISPLVLFTAFTLSFSSCFLLVYFSFEYLIVSELNEAYAMLEKLKKKDFKILKRSDKHALSPFKKLNYEIYSYASKKQKEIDQLKKLALYRREFLADVSHELKTPIFAAQGFLHTLIDGAIDDETVRYKFLHKAANSLDGLHRLVEDLFTLSKMEAGILKMNRARFNLYELAQEIIESLNPTADKKEIRLAFSPETCPDAWVWADQARIGQVLTNLIENAIKYGHNGGKVCVSIEDLPYQVALSVEDDGPGISPEHLDRIFERFYRVEKSRSKAKGGSGLGLAIVKHILEAHQSKVLVSSQVAQGTIFSFKLEKPQDQNGEADALPTVFQPSLPVSHGHPSPNLSKPPASIGL
ncbi:MAG: two-component sensor histidine kinase [Microscillaceae bacterium]|nr:two-component sensor histidine kinase [Microscillaceae bacterium]